MFLYMSLYFVFRNTAKAAKTAARASEAKAAERVAARLWEVEALGYSTRRNSYSTRKFSILDPNSCLIQYISNICHLIY